MILYSPEKWCELTGIVIIDPDGWDRGSQTDYNRAISFSEFYNKAIASTASGIRDYRVMVKALGL